MRLRTEDLEPVVERLRDGMSRVGAHIHRAVNELISKPSPGPVRATGQWEPPPRLRELEPADPLREIVERVCAGDTLGESDLHVLQEACGQLDRRNWKRALVTAWTLGRARLEPDLQDEPLGILAGCMQNRRYSINACTTPLLLGCLLNWLLSLPLLIYMAARDGRISAIRTEAAASLALLDCEWAVGDLAEAARTHNKPGSGRLRETAVMALRRLLPRIGPTHYGRLPASAVRSLCQLLHRRHAELHPLVLDALAHVGGAADMSAIETLTGEGWPASTREKAMRALQTVRERTERERQVARLLRPAEAPGSPQEVLLRPVEAAPSGDVELLVRPLEGNEP